MLFRSVFEIIEEDGLSDQKVKARSIMKSILSFEFVFALHLIKNILGITNELLIALQKKKKKNQDIVNVIWILLKCLSNDYK